ncbi:MAG: hypothetical protein AB1529_07825 [Candidatus Micrarchaeota archaeon]
MIGQTPCFAGLPALAASKKFGRYGPEAEKASRTGQYKREEFNDIMDLWQRMWDSQKATRDLEKMYEEAAKGVEALGMAGIEFGEFAARVAELSILLPEDEGVGLIKHNNFRAGIALSAVINCSSRELFDIDLDGVGIALAELGYRNVKEVTFRRGAPLYGTASDFNLGNCMEKGSIDYHGGIFGRVGRKMSGGVIRIHGDAISSPVGNLPIGAKMTGGEIWVFGNADNLVGPGMRGGEIHFEGDFGGISETMISGRIYHKGRLIVDK